MLKKSLLSLAVTASLVGLAGCDISSTTANSGAKPELQKQQEAYLASITYPVFDAVNSRLPLGIDLIFADAGDTDGTANVGATGGNPVFDAINDLDGISTLAPIDIAISGGIDPDSVVAGGNVHLVRLPNAADIDPNDLILPTVGDVTSAADVDALDITTLSPFFAQTKADGTAADDSAFAAGMGLPESVAALNLYGANDGVPLSPASPNETDGIIAKQPVANTDFEVTVISLDGGTNNTIRISPKVPLDPKTKYIVAITDGITNAAGEKIKPSPDYSVIRASTDAAGEPTAEASKLASSALVDVSKAINGWELLASTIVTQGSAANAANLGGNIVFTSAFTTTDPTTVLGAMTAPAAALPAALNPGSAVSGAIEPQPREFEFIPVTGNQISVKTLTYDAEEMTSSIPLDVNISQGAIKLPQYVEAFGVDPSDSWEALNTAVTPADADDSNNVTYRFPFAAEKRDAVVPLLMFEPIGSGTNTCVKPGAGWPVVILQHGFTSSRAGNLINGSNIANFTCHAVISMDLPHHGVAADAGAQLAFNVEQADGLGAETKTPWATVVDGVIAGNADTPDNTILDELKERHEGFYLDPINGVSLMDFDNEAGGSGSLFIRLDNFQRTRDNMRQSVMDLMNLNASLGSIDLDGTANGPDLDVTDVKYIGHSLGAIVGTPFVALNNGSLGGNGNLNPIQAAVLATPGGQMTKLIENSVAFSRQFLPGLASVNETLVQGNSALESYMKVYQATLDSADPINFLGALKSVNAGLNTPILLLGMYGGAALGDSVYPSDLAVPVTGDGSLLADGSTKAPSAENPLTGLQPFVDLLGAENVTGAPAGNIYIAKYNEGSHGTFSSAGSRAVADAEGNVADPLDSADAYAEMRAQIVDLLDDGALDANKAATVLIAD